MDKVTLSQDAYTEFKSFLDENSIDKYSIRINYAGSSCSGPVFNISVDDAKEEDVVEKHNDVSFLMQSELVDEFGGFIILSSEENEGRGLSLRPLIAPEGGCGSCHGCH